MLPASDLKRNEERKGKEWTRKTYQLNQILPPVNDLVPQSSTFLLKMHLLPHLWFFKNKISVIQDTLLVMEPFNLKNGIPAVILKSFFSVYHICILIDQNICLYHSRLPHFQYSLLKSVGFTHLSVTFITAITHLISFILKKGHISLLPNPGLVSYCWRDHCQINGWWIYLGKSKCICHPESWPR